MAPPRSKYRGLQRWFRAAEDLGEFIGIRFGLVHDGRPDPEWFYYSHREYDGIGGFADLLRQRGADLGTLPLIKYYPAYSAVGAAVRHWPHYLAARRQLAWRPLPRDPVDAVQAPLAVAWHVFDEVTTATLRVRSRQAGFTVNTFLLKALDLAIRPSLEQPDAVLPWMVPVNMRGGVNQYRDTDNHSSYVVTHVRPTQPPADIHRRILQSLSRGEHWGNWHALKLGCVLTRGMRHYFVRTGRCTAEWTIGSFSNLGEWDPEKKLTIRDGGGHWLFAPPTLRIQHLGAGCLTFQGSMSLLLQAHHDLTTSPAVAREWMGRWVEAIQAALSACTRA